MNVVDDSPEPATTGVATGIAAAGVTTPGIGEPGTTPGTALGAAGILTGELPGLPATEMVVAVAVGTGAMAAAGVGAGVLPV